MQTEPKPGTLYIVATPIGSLNDLQVLEHHLILEYDIVNVGRSSKGQASLLLLRCEKNYAIFLVADAR